MLLEPAELHRGDDPVVAEYILDAAAKRMTPTVREVLSRYPRVVAGRSRVSILMARLDSLLRDPAPPTRVVDDPGPFFHGTRAAVQVGDLLSPGWQSNYGSRRRSNHIYVTASEWGAPLAAELAQGEGPPRVYRVEALGMLHDDPNVTDKKFPGNVTQSYRTRHPMVVVDEVPSWEGHAPEVLQGMLGNIARLREQGLDVIED